MNIIHCFDIKGNKLDKGTLKDGTGIIKDYDKNGKFLSETKFIDGLRDSR